MYFLYAGAHTTVENKAIQCFMEIPPVPRVSICDKATQCSIDSEASSPLELSLSCQYSLTEAKPTRLAERARRESELIKDEVSEQLHPVYQLNKFQTLVNTESRVAKYVVGHEPMKVLMLVGATGAGKTTLINGIANYMYGVQWDDDFRFNLVAQESANKYQMRSRTDWVTAYTLHRDVNSPIPYSLTIIDTPGFGDNEGIERNKKIVNQIKDFFALKLLDVDILHGIMFVVQASLAQLSFSQRYIFDAILSMYGRDMANNIFMMVSFADRQVPPVIEAIKGADIPYQTYFKFNNLALFVKGEDEDICHNALMWQNDVESFKDFFIALEKVEHRSLELTFEVLNIQEQLKNVLQPQIDSGLLKINYLLNVLDILERKWRYIEENKDFVLKIPGVIKQRKIDIFPGQSTTNCQNCSFTCHEICTIANDDNKKLCDVMDRNGYCTVCPENCKWSEHVSNPYIFESYKEEKKITFRELKAQFMYNTAKKDESQTKLIIIDNIKRDVKSLKGIILGQVSKVRHSLNRLNEIALKPNPLTEVDFIDQLIKSEKQKDLRRRSDQVAAYKILHKQAVLLRKIKDHKEGDSQESLFAWLRDNV